MAKTLLQITQDILQDIGGDDVSSIFDTEEAEAVARHVVATYDNLVASENWPWMRRMVQLVASGDSNFPNYMTLPTNVKKLDMINYDEAKVTDTRKKFGKMHFKDPDDFLRYTNARNDTDANVMVVTDPSGIQFFIRNDISPTYYTTYDDNTLIFDAYDSAVDSTLQANKTQAIAYILLTLAVQDDAVPDLPLDAERLLIEEATARVQWKEKEMQDPEAIRAATKQRRFISREAWRTNKPTRYPDYGRGRRNRTYEPTFVRND
jgi:hypothetical protein